MTLYALLFKVEQLVELLPLDRDWFTLLEEQVQDSYIILFTARGKAGMNDLLGVVAHMAYSKSIKIFYSSLLGQRYRVDIVHIIYQIIYGVDLSDKFV